MKMQITEMLVTFRKSKEVIDFSRFTYFHGKIGAGKSTIARLIDFCLGGDLDMTPAMQSEFVDVTLSLFINESEVFLYRQRGSGSIQAQWTHQNQPFEALIPLVSKKEEIVLGTGVENLSDLLFFLGGIHSPKVRKSRMKDDAELVRLSFRDLFWYCYLDQDNIDSNFFNLDVEANVFKRNKSRDVLRFIIGFHQERVAELEAQLDETRTRRLTMIEAAKALRDALNSVDVETEFDIQQKILQRQEELQSIAVQIATIRQQGVEFSQHGADRLRQQGRAIGVEIDTVEEAVSSIESLINDHTRHLNELTTLSVKFRRTTSARAVLNGVEFEKCPRCGQSLPEVPNDHCRVCGQPENNDDSSEIDISLTAKDITSRIEELRELIGQHRKQLSILQRQRRELYEQKMQVDIELNQVLQQYDSAYLSSNLTLERQQARLYQEIIELERLQRLSQMVEYQENQAVLLQNKETQLRSELKEARKEAERDSSNLRKLEDFFLDCLIRAKIPGFSRNDIVSISSPYFLPEVSSLETQGLITTSFANLGSGGKKTLFKICFAIAIHRLATEINAFLPTLLIIDSPMKNISERENREQYEGLHELLYELAASELRNTQFIMIDKEYYAPPQQFANDIIISERRMTPDDPSAPPLVQYYIGH